MEQYVEDLQALIPTVVQQPEKAQATYNSAFDARTTVTSESVKAEDWVNLDAHSRSQKKLGFCRKRIYIVLKTDGHGVRVESPRVFRTGSSDHVTGATAPPVWDAKWTCALRAQPLVNVDE